MFLLHHEINLNSKCIKEKKNPDFTKHISNGWQETGKSSGVKLMKVMELGSGQ